MDTVPHPSYAKHSATCGAVPISRYHQRMARTPMRPVNFRAKEADIDLALGTALAAGRNFPDEFRAWMAWWTRQPGARLPARPTAEEVAAGPAALAEAKAAKLTAA